MATSDLVGRSLSNALSRRYPSLLIRASSPSSPLSTTTPMPPPSGPFAFFRCHLPKASVALASASASLLLFSGDPGPGSMAFALTTIKMGADEGTLVFSPASVTVPAGEKIVFLNNKGFPHNIVFQKDGVPEGVDAASITHEDYLSDPGEKYTVVLREKGAYKYFCEPHKSAGMLGEIIVN